MHYPQMPNIFRPPDAVFRTNVRNRRMKNQLTNQQLACNAYFPFCFFGHVPLLIHDCRARFLRHRAKIATATVGIECLTYYIAHSSLTALSSYKSLSAPVDGQRKMPTTSYELAVDTWTNTDSIEITSTSNSRIASFPLSFIQTGGDNTWRYVLKVVDQLVEKDSDQLGVIIDTHGVAVNLDDAPSSGLYYYEQTRKSILFQSPQTVCINIIASF